MKINDTALSFQALNSSTWNYSHLAYLQWVTITPIEGDGSRDLDAVIDARLPEDLLTSMTTGYLESIPPQGIVDPGQTRWGLSRVVQELLLGGRHEDSAI